MTPETERIPVPTNGKGPHPMPDHPPLAAPTADGAEPLPTTVVFTPTQLAVGFGILASLLLLAAGWLRRRGGGPGGRLGRR
jgi:hypothetical protein